MKFKIASVVLAGVLVLSFVFPTFIFAQGTQGKGNGNNGNGDGLKLGENAFCNVISNNADKILGRMTDKEGKLSGKRSEWRERKETHWNTLLDNKNANRLRHEEKRGVLFSKLEEKAGTDEQKAAILAFKTAVQNAVSQRQAAVDVAMNTFHIGANTSIDENRAKIDELVTVYKNAISVATEKAKNACAQESADAKAIRDTFRADMKTATDKFREDRGAIEKVKASFDSVSLARREAVKKANDEFKEKLEKARADLKAVFADL